MLIFVSRCGKEVASVMPPRKKPQNTTSFFTQGTSPHIYRLVAHGLMEQSVFLFGSKNGFLGAIFSHLPALKPAALAGLAFPGTQLSEGDVCGR